METTYSYDHYYLQEEIGSHVKGLAEKYPSLMTWEVLLTTPDGHPMYAVTLTNSATGKPEDKPAFHIDGNTHAGEVTGMMAAMHTMDHLCSAYGKDPKVTWILDNLTVYIIPCVSPDGSQTYLTTPYTLRSVNRDYYELKDGLSEEDMDGDGCIRMMRVKDPRGAWKKDPSDPDLMRKRLPDDTEGEFYSVYTEGEFVGWDGTEKKIRRPKWGLDFNRNYPYAWFPEGRQPGAGPYPLSNPETKALAEWIIGHPNIGSVATNHTSGGVLLKVPGTCPEKNAPAADMALLKKIGDMGTETTGYRHVNIFDSFVTDKEHFDSGAFDDFCYETRGIYAMTLELWDLGARCGLKPFWEAGGEEWDDVSSFAKKLSWVKENAPVSFLSWKPFTHPQLGEAEIGGFDVKFTEQNPPPSFLKQECEKTTAFLLRWASAMPRLVIDRVETRKVAPGVYGVDAWVSNAGFLPTYVSEKAKALGVSRPVTVSVDVPEEDLVNCKAEQEIGDLSSYGLTPTGAWHYGNITTGNGPAITKKVSWIVKGKRESVTVTASCPKAGKKVLNVKL